MNGMFARRAQASEWSSSREEDKSKLKRLRERLVKDGYLKADKKGLLSAGERSSACSAGGQGQDATVDVLATISAHSIPIQGKLGAQYDSPSKVTKTIIAPDPKAKHLALPTQGEVAASIYREHLGKKNWVNALSKAIEPKLQKMRYGAPPAVRPLRPQDLRKLEQSAKGTVGAFVSVVLGSVVCVTGAMIAGAVVWRQNFNRGKDGSVVTQLSARMPERARAINEGPVGKIVSGIGASAQQSVEQSESLKRWEGGLKKQFGPH